MLSRTSVLFCFEHPSNSVPTIRQILFRPSVKFCSEHHVVFISNIGHFLFRSSCSFHFEHLTSFLYGHPVFLIPNFRLFHSEHPAFFRQTEVRNELLRQMFVKKTGRKGDYPKKTCAFHLIVQKKV